MYKVVWIARYAKDKTKQEASDYWAGHHGPLMKNVQPVAGYVQSHVQGPLPLVTGVAEEETFFDGYSCAWWNDPSDFERAMAQPEWQLVVDDGPNVFDIDWLSSMSAHIEENTVIDGPTSPYKVVWICRFKEGISRDEGRDYWRTTHGPIFQELDIHRYVQNHVVGPIGVADETDSAEIGFDGFSECWFRDEQQFLDAVESETWARAVEDGPNFLDMTQLWRAVLKENVVIQPPQLARR